ncbi:MAG: hypothetical protein FJ100_23705 [Deltaproteobacteria bacterium]|nr:hypothetical protein [Deltaproteobacteria bacterium]
MHYTRNPLLAAIAAASVAVLVACEATLPPQAATVDGGANDAGNVGGQDAKGDATTCANNAACPAGSYCAYPEGKCNTAGKCQVKPTVCTKELKEVCGCDGNSYPNPCNAAAAGASVASPGKCGGSVPPGDCDVAKQSGCAAAEYCQSTGIGVCGGKGVCVQKPEVCTADYAPVCGCDGMTHSNACGAAGAGTNVASQGKCAEPIPVGCDVAGQTGCAAGQYCKSSAVGVCSGQGTCTVKPQVCAAIGAPVCGCDGKTHDNACGAAGAGTNVASNGACGANAVTLKWYMTCGAPVCGGWTPKNNVPLCTTEAAGDPCKMPGGQCDPKDSCNALLVCADKDPKAGGMGCPISKAKYKSDIRYVQAAEARDLATRLLATRLATYKYTAQGPNAPTRLGFIIDDDPGSPAVDPERDMVDLYGYLSMAVATLQQQGKEIESLRREVASLKATSPKEVPPMCSR